ncbi:hypothetical protein TNIN_348231 [Trichonephila inaurata madagascariensis]|uniref:Uncharacterized protein n=1 Tax=Trichonephila inaurata madagascariensis TaxID=2747483 RepID=A0A8X7BVY0_9ARAC|nr:hypothetical protein TNIN_348231 [Trichonephila inaurata madagascariensis]
MKSKLRPHMRSKKRPRYGGSGLFSDIIVNIIFGAIILSDSFPKKESLPKKVPSTKQIPVDTDLIIELLKSDEKIPEWNLAIHDLMRKAVDQLGIRDMQEDEEKLIALRIRRGRPHGREEKNKKNKQEL